MPPSSHKIKGFISDWTKSWIDVYCVGSWLTSDPNSIVKARSVRKMFIMTDSDAYYALQSPEIHTGYSPLPKGSLLLNSIFKQQPIRNL